MMWSLLISTILASAVDSLNPFAITQQFVLQGMVKKPKDILYFIIPTGVTNLLGGLLAYFGLVAFIGDIANQLLEAYGQLLFTIELVLGIGFLVTVGYLIQQNATASLNKKIQELKDEKGGENKGDSEEAEVASQIKSVSPTTLVALGVGATLSELTTALPYFAFMAILFNYQLTFIQVSFILVVYNVIYTMPLIVLYVIYLKAQNQFNRLYTLIKRQISKWSRILAPATVGIIGLFLIFHSISELLQ